MIKGFNLLPNSDPEKIGIAIKKLFNSSAKSPEERLPTTGVLHQAASDQKNHSSLPTNNH